MSAVFSDCGTYRYRLDRQVQAEGLVFAFFGVNPSKAGAEVEDQTTMKWHGFTRRNGGRAYIAGNPFALRSTNVHGLRLVSDPVGPLNRQHIDQIISEADVLVPCWGSRQKLPRALHVHLDRLTKTLRASGKPVRIFGLTATGDPLHPLFLGYDTPLVAWKG